MSDFNDDSYWDGQRNEIEQRTRNAILGSLKPNLKLVNVKSGSEGPKHDPYSFAEYSFGEFKLHLGLGNWLHFKKLEINSTDEGVEDLIEMFCSICGCTLEEIDWYRSFIYEEDPMGRPEDYI